MGVAHGPMEFLVTHHMRLHINIANSLLVLMLIILSSPGQLWAAPEDTVQAYVSESITHDDNLLRIPKGVDPMTVSGQSSTADTIKQSTLGVRVDWKQSRQEVILDASVNESKFSRFTSLNYQSKNIQSRWNWQLGNTLSGDAGYNRNTTLGSYAAVQRLANNLSTQQNSFFDAAWQIKPDLRLNSGVTHGTYSVTGNPDNNYEFNSYTVGASFTPRSGNEVGIKGNRLEQKYPVLESFSGVQVDNGFSQSQLLATANWLYSGLIRVNGQIGVVNRAHNQLSARDFNGKTMRGTLTWFATGKSLVDLTAWDEIDGYDSLTTSYTQSKGISLGSTWNPTGKLSVSAKLQHLNRAFLGDPALLTSGVSRAVRKDSVNTTSLSVNYQPVRSVNISTSIKFERLGSNQSAVGYADKTINLIASFMF